MTREDVLQDVAYARALAEEGRRAPLIGGAYLILFGVLLTLAYLAHWAIWTGAWPVAEPTYVGFVWMGFGAFAAVGVAALRRRTKRMPGGASVSNQVDRYVWQAVSIGILVVVFATVPRSMLFNDHNAPNAIMAVGFCLYGLALHVTARMSDERWLSAFALLAWLASGLLFFFLNSPTSYLLAAAAAAAVLFAPGVMLMQREPKTVV